ncbi:MAG: pentapeptide repeat-containing protein [Pyrinomonadaceae bacterium]
MIGIPVQAQVTQSSGGSRNEPELREQQRPPAPKIRFYRGRELSEILKDETTAELSNAVVTEELAINDTSLETLKFTNVTFEEDLQISGAYISILFEHCHFKRNVDFYLVETLTLTMRDCDFLGAASFNIDVSGFQLRECDFAKTVSLYGTTFDQNQGAINMTYLSTREPIRIFWSQFGDKWLEGLKKAADDLGNPSLRESNLRQILSELEFWKDNFSKLGHHRDAAEVNYEIIQFARQNKISLGRDKVEWWASLILSWPSRYGTHPYRPVWLGLLVIFIFGFVLWVKDPFMPDDSNTKPKPREPRLLFAMMYSVNTFFPIIEVTGVKNWGWQPIGAYRWLIVIERIFGLLILYVAAYSLTYYTL